MMLRNCWIRHLRFAPLLLAGAVGVTACDFQVVNPGRIMEEDLNSDAAVEALVTGMSADFSEEYDGVAFIVARASDDMAGSGSYNTTNFFRQGIIFNDEIQGEWEGTQRARWVAEDGLRRMQEEMEGYEFGGDEPTARAYLLAGLANRVVAEAFCNSTVSANAPLGGVPGGEGALSTDEAFQRAANFLAEAITHGTTAGEQDIVDAARGGRAQAYVGLGDWANAVLEARQVATDFVYEAIYSNNTDREENEIREETHQREEMSVYDTYIATIDPPDPRAPYTNCPADPDACSDVVKGADGITPYWRQEKYPDKGSNMAVVKGTEMRLIEAEAELRNGQLAEAVTLMNEVRTFHRSDTGSCHPRRRVDRAGPRASSHAVDGGSAAARPQAVERGKPHHHARSAVPAGRDNNCRRQHVPRPLDSRIVHSYRVQRVPVQPVVEGLAGLRTTTLAAR